MSVGMDLPPALVLALCNMLQLSVRESGWNIGTKVMPQQIANLDGSAAEITDKNKVLH
jgi:hypothetical protein